MTDTTGHPQRFQRGDHVRHKPSGEEWVLKRAGDDWVEPAGWPPSRAMAKDCELVESVDAQRARGARVLTDDDQAPYDPHAPGPPREVSEDAAARERTADEKTALRVLAWVRTDTVRSGVLPGDMQREELLTRSIVSRVAEAVREAAEQARAEEREQQIARFMRIVNDADERLRIRSDIHPDCHGGIQAVLAEIVQSVRSVDDPQTQTPGEQAYEMAQLKWLDKGDFANILAKRFREAADAAHAAGKAEGAAEERGRAARILDARAAKLNDPHCSVAATLRKLSSNIRSEGGDSDV